ncbi:hypothetical protein [Klebsiella variicola]|uniref:hypothetical protein n=1 Tax=Klebsiella variicola TaxID=244366 RepID=UPI000E2CAFDA|nr:hypothetical protein [Klebsiella variicola]SXF90119.1 Uncharacterised protein [Klebsiella variicola]
MLERFIDVLNKDVLFDLSATPSPDSSVLVVREDGELSEINDSIAFTLDFSSKKNSKENGALFSQLSPYFDKSNGDGVNKSCDLVLITRDGDKFTVLIFDQKSKKPDIESSFLQLENSRVFVSYVINIISLIYKDNIDEGKIVFKRVIGTTRVVKTGVNAANHEQERSRREKLRALGMNEVSIKRTASIEKGWLDYRGIVSF